MPSYKLDFYSLVFNVKGDPQEKVSLEEILDPQHFSEFFQSFLNEMEKQMEIDTDSKKTYQFQENSIHVSMIKSMISGIIKLGEYGRASDVVNVLTQQIKDPLDKNDSIINPHYFVLAFPQKIKLGFLGLQRTGNSGIGAVFFKYFKAFFKDRYPNYTLTISPLANKELLLKLITDSQLSEIRLRKYAVPSDAADRYFKGGIVNDNKTFSATLSLHVNKGFFGVQIKDKVLSYVNDPDAKFFDFPELKQVGFDGQVETSVVIQKDGQTRTVVLEHLNRFKPSFDIYEDLKFDNKGNPTFDSINKIAIDILEENFLP